MVLHGDFRGAAAYDWAMASIEKVPSRLLTRLSLVPPLARRPDRLGWVNSLRASLRAQTVVLFILLVGFAASAEVIVQGQLQASNAAQAEQVGLITWRYDTVRASLSAQELRNNLAKMNNSLLAGDSPGAASFQALAEANITFIESDLSQIAALGLGADDGPVIAKDAQAFQSLTTFARQFIAAGQHTDEDMLAQTDVAFTAWSAGHAPVDSFIQAQIQENQVVIDAGKATSNRVQLF